MFGRHRPLSSPFYPAARLRPHDPPMTPPSVRRATGEWPAPPPERPRTDPPPPSRFADERRYRAVEEPPSSKPTAPSQGTPPAPPSAPRAVAAPIAPDADDRAAVRRALADLEAAERRVEANAKRVYDETRAKLVTEVLPVLDDLDRTIRASEKSADRALLTGVRMVRTELEGILVRFGLEPIAAKDVAFDPAIHEAIMGVPTADPALAGRVIDEVTPGYRFGGKVLRAAKVTVGVAEEVNEPAEGDAADQWR
jgi:molecular chaperone GrpE (heat shock protein)